LDLFSFVGEGEGGGEILAGIEDIPVGFSAYSYKEGGRVLVKIGTEVRTHFTLHIPNIQGGRVNHIHTGGRGGFEKC
jgi:hypothetical protein